MSSSFDKAVKDVRARREALQSDVSQLRSRLSPPQLAEDALGLVDPDLTLLGRFKERIQHNRLLSLAVLAGVGWLVGAPRHQDGDAFGARQAGTTPSRANMKEKNNDSGQYHGDQWTGAAGRRAQERAAEEPAQEAVLARRSRQAQPERGGTPLHGEPQQPAGERSQVPEQQQQGEERPQQQPEVLKRQL